MHPSCSLSRRRNSRICRPLVYTLLSLVVVLYASGAHAEVRAASQDHYRGRNLAPSYANLVERYIPDFLGIDPSLIERADDELQSLSNNVPGKSNIQAGEFQYWTFPKTALERAKAPKPKGLPSPFQPCPDGGEVPSNDGELRKRQNVHSLYITLNTCDQPTPRRSTANGAPDQLKLFVSTSSSNQKPDADKSDHTVPVDGGYGSIDLTVTGDVFIGVSAPTSNDFSGVYNYEIVASIDDYYAKYEPHRASYYIDSDKQSAIIYTNDTTSCNSSNPLFSTWQGFGGNAPFSMFVARQDDSSILGLQRSLCGLKNHAQVKGTSDIERNMTLANGGQPKQQFYVKGLNASTPYYAIVGLEGTDGNASSIGNGKVNGGGTVWDLTNYTTKSSPNCAIVYGMDFCSEVAYAVPSSNSTAAADLPGLRGTYDNWAYEMYQNFSRSLQQIPCNTTASAQYSLATNCTACAAAYKTWLCAVTMPRCEDISNNANYLLERAVNKSRNPLIDSIIKPGPYKELLPCEDLCYNLVRHCPAALGFSCPLKGHGLDETYGKLEPAAPGEWTCSFPGRNLSAAASLQGGSLLAASVATLTILWTLFS